jgi:hypothetical protein
MSGREDASKLLDELEKHLDELPMHLYIFIWSVSEMDQRFKRSPTKPEFGKICYPFTVVPLFDEKESTNLEELWRKNIDKNETLFPEQPKKGQSGGRMKMSFADIKKKSAQFGQAMNFAVQTLDPKKISPDYLFDYTTELFDNMDAGLTEASNTFGLVALETTMPDPTLVIPTVPPIPLPIPARTILPVINAILEAIRIAIGVIYVIDPFGFGNTSRILVTLIMVLLDLARGNLYHAIFTSFGFIGTTPMYVGIALKILRDAMMLVSPSLRTELRYLLFQSSKSMTVGFGIWLFTILSPKFVKVPLETLFNSVSMTLDNINAQIDTAEMQANLSPAGRLATIRLPRIPSDKIPDINNLYALREAIREPAIYCDPKIADLMDELRGVPPYAIFFDMVLIPAKGTPEYQEQCAIYGGRSMSDNLAAAMTPQIIPNNPMMPMNPIVATAAPQDIAGAATGQLPPITTPVSALPMVPPPPGQLGDLAATNPQAAALGALAGSSPMGALAAQAATNPQAAALGALASSSPMGALAAQAATNPQGAALGALAGSSPLGAMAAQAATNPQGAALGALAGSSPLGAMAAKVGKKGTGV